MEFISEYNRKSYNCLESQLSYIEQYKDSVTRQYSFNDVAFACILEGAKEISSNSGEIFDLIPQNIVINSEKNSFKSKAKDPHIKTKCFILEVSRSKVNTLAQKIISSIDLDKENINLKPQLTFNSYNLNENINLTHSIVNIFNAHQSNVAFKDVLVTSNLNNLILNSFQLKWLTDLKNKDLATKNSFSYILDYIDNNLSTPLSIDILSNIAYMSRATFFRKFKRVFGKTPIQYISEVRIKKSKELIENTDKSISEISKIVGFSSESYYIKVYKEFFSETPLHTKKKSINQ